MDAYSSVKSSETDVSYFRDGVDPRESDDFSFQLQLSVAETIGRRQRSELVVHETERMRGKI
jgi:hypothetical protein